ncbi:MAG: hypothetical protein OJF49_003163 [Ktedonobacterales bacterium]|nr:MAG: hypothetical protein OJF49_003163 [Ktedonobacterales bacterium]
MDIGAFLTTWSFEPMVLLGLVAAALLYVRGLDYVTKHGLAQRLAWWRIPAYFAGLLTILIALESEVDLQAGKLLWVHMVQHDLLTMVAPPLLLLGLPTWTLWRAVPTGTRRGVLSWALRARWPWRVGHALTRFFTEPRVSLALFLGVFLAWHVPALYDLALEQQPIHIMEHLMFLGVALLFWAQIIPARVLARSRGPRLSYPMQALYLAAAALVLNVLGGVFVFSTGPLYRFYAALPRAADAPSVLVDQHLAGAAMDVPGTIIFFIIMITVLAKWLAADEREAQAESAPGGATRTTKSSAAIHL